MGELRYRFQGNRVFSAVLMAAGLFLLSFSAQAQSSTTVNQSTAEAKKESPFSMAILLRGDSALKAPSDSDYSAESSLWLNPGYKLSPLYSLSALFVVTQGLTDEKETKTTDLLLTGRRKGWVLNKHLNISPAVTLKAPTSKASAKDEGLVMGVKAGPRLNFDLGRLKGFHDVGVYQNFHKYRTSLTQKSNARNTLINWTNLNYAVSQKFAIDFTMQYTTAWTYQGNMKSSFEFETALEFNASDSMTVSLGLTNGGNIYQADGVSSNLALYDADKSTFFSSLSLKL